MHRRLLIPPLFAALLFFGCGEPAPRETAAPLSSEQDPVADAPPLQSAAVGDVPRLTRAGDVYMAGQPAPDDIRALGEAGITRIVNLRKPMEMAGFDEAEAAREAGIEYVALPFNGPQELTDEVFDRTRDLLRSSDEPTLVHCASSNRVGAVWLPYRVLDQGVELEQAVAEAKQAGMRSPEYEAMARDYIARHR